MAFLWSLSGLIALAWFYPKSLEHKHRDYDNEVADAVIQFVLMVVFSIIGPFGFLLALLKR